ncbi:MAG: 2-C-methyl-D-erythritol 4-phosphate cytidylyltransferase [Burkholderiales bacterium]|nr:2-C-methyl-D-erythritol 4-phosphate cytidylyltransferase [Burkholderiales bacterium]
MTQYLALVPAAGSGSRMGGAVPKQYSMLAGKPMIRHAIESLCNLPEIQRVFVVLSGDDAYWRQYDWSEFAGRLVPLHCGGETRAMSVMNGLKAIDAGGEDWVMVHDAARPCIDLESLKRLMDGLAHDAVGGLLALPVADTLKRENGAGRIAATVSREGLWQAQTPQMFRYRLLLDALSHAPAGQTDEAGAVEALGFSPKLVLGDPRNFKVTYPRDIEFAEMILADRNRS